MAAIDASAFVKVVLAVAVVPVAFAAAWRPANTWPPSWL